MATPAHSLVELLAYLRIRLGDRFTTVDLNDPELLGITIPNSEELICVSARGKAPGRFDLDYDNQLYADCLTPGVEWAVRDLLSR